MGSGSELGRETSWGIPWSLALAMDSCYLEAGGHRGDQARARHRTPGQSVQSSGAKIAASSRRRKARGERLRNFELLEMFDYRGPPLDCTICLKNFPETVRIIISGVNEF